jgi:hypothetical protein
LHIAGQSRYKNSKAVAYAFAKCFDEPEQMPLIFVGAYPEEVEFARGAKNVTYIQRATDEELKHLINECMYHIMPSGTEGWGHVIHEGLGAKAVVVCTDYPPMNEYGIDKELLAKVQTTKPNLVATEAFVGAFEVAEVVKRLLKLTPERIHAIQESSREYFLKQRDEFRARFKAVVENK